MAIHLGSRGHRDVMPFSVRGKESARYGAIGTIPSGILIVLLLSGSMAPFAASAQLSADERQALAQQLEALEKEAAALDAQIAQTQTEANTLKNQVKIFDSEIKRRELEIKKLNLAVRQADIDIQAKGAGIIELSGRIGKNTSILGDNIRKLNEYDKENTLIVLAKNETLSDFFAAFDSLRELQDQTKDLLGELRDNRKQLQDQKADLEDHRAQQLSLKALAEVERRSVVEKKVEKDRLLVLTKGVEALYQQLLSQKKKDITALRNQLFYIAKTGLSAEEALRFAQIASQRTGIRTAFLLALLEVETGRQFENGKISAGTNLGTGNWKTDLYNCYVSLGRVSAAEAQKSAFFEITGKLGLDPNKMPVSRAPNYGCGGAMGPAQFLPTTWLLFEKKVASLTGHNPPSPWNGEDAFTAAAVFLGDSGAKSQARAGELAAARTYISGRPSCPASGAARTACISYANRVLSLAADIDKVI